MIDWTDRSEDVLARYRERNRLLAAGEYLLERREGESEAEWLRRIANAESQLMADLATMVDELSASIDSLVGEEYGSPEKVRMAIMRLSKDKTGARLFPDPKE